MKTKKIVFLLLILLSTSPKIFSIKKDSLLFIQEVKNFSFKEIGVELKGDFFTKIKETEKPYIYVYTSLPYAIENPIGYESFFFCDTNTALANKKIAEYKAQGYHTFLYKTFANSEAMLNKRFFMYPKEAEVFIIFHELTHNYIAQQNLKVPYDYNEALSDLIGNYGTLNFYKANNSKEFNIAQTQMYNNERIYFCMNSYIAGINRKPRKADLLDTKCDNEIKIILKECNLFQNDRFNFTVNNAYLLKNQFYSKNYFLLKKVLQKQKTIKALLDVMKSLPENSEECEKYLLRFT